MCDCPAGQVCWWQVTEVTEAAGWLMLVGVVALLVVTVFWVSLVMRNKWPWQR